MRMTRCVCQSTEENRRQGAVDLYGELAELCLESSLVVSTPTLEHAKQNAVNTC